MAEQKLSPSAIPAKAEIKPSKGLKKRAVLYARVSTADQHPETQLLDLRQMAHQRGYEVVQEYVDTISGSKSKRQGLDRASWRPDKATARYALARKPAFATSSMLSSHVWSCRNIALRRILLQDGVRLALTKVT